MVVAKLADLLSGAADQLDHHAVGVLALLLDLADALLQLLQRFADRLDQVVDGLLALLEVRVGEFAVALELVLGLFPELLVAQLQRIERQALEALLEIRSVLLKLLAARAMRLLQRGDGLPGGRKLAAQLLDLGLRFNLLLAGSPELVRALFERGLCCGQIDLRVGQPVRSVRLRSAQFVGLLACEPRSRVATTASRRTRPAPRSPAQRLRSPCSYLRFDFVNRPVQASWAGNSSGRASVLPCKDATSPSVR